MPVTSTIIKESFLGNGDASTPYTFTFTYDDGNDIKVLIDGVATTAFTHSGNDIRTDVAVPNTSTVTIYRETPKIQTQPFPSNTTPAAEDVRAGFDKLTLIAQEQQEQLDRSVKSSIDTPFVNSSTIGLDSTGNFVSRTAAEESTHLGIGASVAAAKVFADSAEEQAGFAHDERVLAEAAAAAAANYDGSSALKTDGSQTLTQTQKDNLALTWPEAVEGGVNLTTKISTLGSSDKIIIGNQGYIPMSEFALALAEFQKKIPLPADDNLISEIDVTDTAPWATLSGYTVAAVAGGLEFTDTNANTQSKATLTGSGMVASGDYIWYLKFQSTDATTVSYQHVVIGDTTDPTNVHLTIGYNWETGAAGSVVSMAVRATSGGAYVGVATDAMTAPTLNGEHELAVQYDSVNSAYSLYRKIAGAWEFQGSVDGAACYETDIVVYNGGPTGGSTCLIVESFFARPNFASIGDSICAGHNFFDPDPAFYGGDDDWQNSWQYYFQPTVNSSGGLLRNNIVVNYGVGGNSSTESNARTAAMLANTHAKVVFIHASTNDVVKNVSDTTRSANIQNDVDQIVATGAAAVLLNAIEYPNPVQGNAASIAIKNWWRTKSALITNVSKRVDISELLYDSGGIYIDPANVEGDKVHPNKASYAIIGNYLFSQI